MDGFLALRASGCAGLGNRHTGQGVQGYKSSFPFQPTLLSIFPRNAKPRSDETFVMLMSRFRTMCQYF